jgi:nitrile hydratase accessory protein
MPPDTSNVLPGPPPSAAGPVFREPWEAQAFAMVLALHERGLFTWNEWAAALAHEIKAAQAAGDPDSGETYYRHWLGALERLVAEKKIADADTLTRYRQAWQRAAQRTPHGTPIALADEDFATLEELEALEAIDEALGQVARGEVASKEEVEAAFEKFRRG